MGLGKVMKSAAEGWKLTMFYYTVHTSADYGKYWAPTTVKISKKDGNMVGEIRGAEVGSLPI